MLSPPNLHNLLHPKQIQTLQHLPYIPSYLLTILLLHIQHQIHLYNNPIHPPKLLNKPSSKQQKPIQTKKANPNLRYYPKYPNPAFL